ncbi:hypothetical protein D3C80_916330 [compost metagenome]
MGLANGVDGREIQHVEAHGGDFRQAPLDIGEGAMALWVAALRAREQLVPAAELRQAALHVQRVAFAAQQMRAMLGPAHQFTHFRFDQQRHLLFPGLPGVQPVHQLRQLGSQFRRGLGGYSPDQLRAFL